MTARGKAVVAVLAVLVALLALFAINQSIQVPGVDDALVDATELQ